MRPDLFDLFELDELKKRKDFMRLADRLRPWSMNEVLLLGILLALQLVVHVAAVAVSADAGDCATAGRREHGDVVDAESEQRGERIDAARAADLGLEDAPRERSIEIAIEKGIDRVGAIEERIERQKFLDGHVRHRERIVREVDLLAVLIIFEHREVDDPAEAECAFLDQIELLRDSVESFGQTTVMVTPMPISSIPLIKTMSPACASYDQFQNFEKRGDAFRALVEPDLAAKVVIDERSGIIVMGRDVRVSTVAVAVVARRAVTAVALVAGVVASHHLDPVLRHQRSFALDRGHLVLLEQGDGLDHRGQRGVVHVRTHAADHLQKPGLPAQVQDSR